MSDIIATEEQAKSIGSSNVSITSNKMCTKSRALSLSCTVSGTYSYNQLVALKDLGATLKCVFKLQGNQYPTFIIKKGLNSLGSTLSLPFYENDNSEIEYNGEGLLGYTPWSQFGGITKSFTSSITINDGAMIIMNGLNASDIGETESTINIGDDFTIYLYVGNCGIVPKFLNFDYFTTYYKRYGIIRVAGRIYAANTTNPYFYSSCTNYDWFNNIEQNCIAVATGQLNTNTQYYLTPIEEGGSFSSYNSQNLNINTSLFNSLGNSYKSYWNYCSYSYIKRTKTNSSYLQGYIETIDIYIRTQKGTTDTISLVPVNVDTYRTTSDCIIQGNYESDITTDLILGYPDNQAVITQIVCRLRAASNSSETTVVSTNTEGDIYWGTAGTLFKSRLRYCVQATTPSESDYKSNTEFNLFSSNVNNQGGWSTNTIYINLC